MLPWSTVTVVFFKIFNTRFLMQIVTNPNIFLSVFSVCISSVFCFWSWMKKKWTKGFSYLKKKSRMNKWTLCLLIQQAAKFKYGPSLPRPVQVYKHWIFLCTEGMFLRKFWLEFDFLPQNEEFLILVFSILSSHVFHLPFTQIPCSSCHVHCILEHYSQCIWYCWY